MDGRTDHSKIGEMCPLAISNQIFTISMHIQSLVTTHWILLKLSSGCPTDGRTEDTDVQGEELFQKLLSFWHFQKVGFIFYLFIFYVTLYSEANHGTMCKKPFVVTTYTQNFLFYSVALKKSKNTIFPIIKMTANYAKFVRVCRMDAGLQQVLFRISEIFTVLLWNINNLKSVKKKAKNN